MRDIQALLDSGFTKLRTAEAELDHRARWDVPGLAPLEKVAIILNDLFCEVDRGGFDYWLQRRYAAHGKHELQRRVTAIVERHYDLDPLAAEIVLAMMEAIELAPASYDPDAGIPTSDADSEAYQRLCDDRRWLDAAFSRQTKRMWRFVQQVVDAWDESLDPFHLAPETPRPRRRITQRAAESTGPVRYPSVAVGATKAGRSLPYHAEGINVYEIYMTAAHALWMAGVPLERIAEFTQSCDEVREDTAKVIDLVAACVDLDGALARTGTPADREAVVKALEWSPGYVFESMAESVRAGGKGGFIVTAPSAEPLAPPAETAGVELRALGVAEGILLPDPEGPDRAHPVALVADGSAVQSKEVLNQLLDLAAACGILIVQDLAEEGRQHLGFRAGAAGLEHVNLHPDPWAFG